MQIVTISPEGIQERYKSDDHDRPRPYPGTYKKIWDDQAEDLARAGFALGQPVAQVNDLVSGGIYAIRENTKGLWLVVDGGVTGKTKRAKLVDFLSYKRDLIPIFPYETSDGTYRIYAVGRSNGQIVPTSILAVDNPPSPPWSYMDWIDPPGKTKPMAAHITVGRAVNDYCGLSWYNPVTKQWMYLTPKDTGNTPNLIVSATQDTATFEFIPLHITNAGLHNIIKATWPNATVDVQLYEDSYYIGINETEATQIWNNSGLKGHKFLPHVFDCDDFSYVYKAQASKDAFNNNMAVAFAVAIIFGVKTDNGVTEAHAANMYLDQSGNAFVLEPQGGKIVPGQEWDFSPTTIIM